MVLQAFQALGLFGAGEVFQQVAGRSVSLWGVISGWKKGEEAVAG